MGSQGLAPFGARECGNDGGHAVALNHRRPYSLQYFSGEPSHGRGPNEDRQTPDIHILPAKEVADAAHGQDQSADSQRVTHNDPLDSRQVRAEVALDIWQGNHDRAMVHHRHKSADGDGTEHPPFVA